MWMDLGPKSSNNEFVERGLENCVLGNQTNLQMEFYVERMKKKRVCVGINSSRQYPRRSVLIYCCKDQFRLRSNTGMDPGPRSPNNEFVECGKKS